MTCVTLLSKLPVTWAPYMRSFKPTSCRLQLGIPWTQTTEQIMQDVMTSAIIAVRGETGLKGIQTHNLYEPVYCSSNWAIKPSESWQCCEFVSPCEKVPILILNFERQTRKIIAHARIKRCNSSRPSVIPLLKHYKTTAGREGREGWEGEFLNVLSFPL